MSLYYGSSIRKALNCLHEFLAMPRFSRIEIKSTGMTEIAFRNQIGKNENLVARPLAYSGTGTERAVAT